MALDVATVKQMNSKYFHYFYDNEAGDMMSVQSDAILSRNPFFQKGPVWKQNRRDIVPGLTKNRIESYDLIIRNVCKDLNNYLHERIEKCEQVDVADVSKKTNQLITK